MVGGVGARLDPVAPHLAEHLPGHRELALWTVAAVEAEPLLERAAKLVENGSRVVGDEVLQHLVRRIGALVRVDQHRLEAAGSADRDRPETPVLHPHERGPEPVVGDTAVRAGESGRNVDDGRNLHLPHHREGVVVDVAIAVVERDHGHVPAALRLAFEDLERAVESDDVIRRSQRLEVLAEGLLRDVERRQAADRLHLEVPHHPVVAEDEDAPAAHRAPLDRGEQICRARVV